MSAKRKRPVPRVVRKRGAFFVRIRRGYFPSAFFKTATAASVISLPIPSPGITVIFFVMLNAPLQNALDALSLLYLYHALSATKSEKFILPIKFSDNFPITRLGGDVYDCTLKNVSRKTTMPLGLAEALNKSARAPDESFSAMLCQSALDVALRLRLRALFLA